MSKRLIYFAMLLLLVVPLVLTACQPAAPEEAPAEEAAPAEEEMAEEAMGSYYDRAMAGEFAGTAVTMTGPFTDEDAVKFDNSVAAFEEASGIDVQYEGSKEFEAAIGIRVEAGDPPDIVDFPQPGLLSTFVAQGEVVDVSTFLPEASFANYNQSWWDMGTMAGPDGPIVAGVWHRFNAKSQVWYPQEEFEAAGYAIPTTWDELVALSDQIVADGDKPWCVGIESGAATGWPATDWMEEVMLRTTSLENYDMWVTGELPFSSPEVKNALSVLDALWADEYVYGGQEAIVTTFFGDAPTPMFEDPPKCWLHKQGNFITSFFPEGMAAGTDYGFFYLPGIDEAYGSPYLVAGDIMAMFNDRPEVRATMEFFTKGEALKEWLAAGGALAPQMDTNLDWYGDDIERGIAALVAAATSVRFDGSDLMPGEVGAGSFWKGMTDYFAGVADMDTVLSEIDASWPAMMEGEAMEEEAMGLSCDEPIKVGLISDGTGPLAIYGAHIIRAFMLGMEYATGAPGSVGEVFTVEDGSNTFMLDDCEIEVLFGDDQTNPDLTTSVAREFVEVDEVDVLVGTVSSGNTATLQEIAAENKIPLIVAPAAANDITGVNFNEYTFRTSRENYQDAMALCEHLVKDYNSFVQIAPDYSFGWGGAAAFRDACSLLGGEFPVDDIFAPFDTTDFTPYMEQVLDSGAEVWIPTWAGGGFIAIMQSALDLGVVDEMTMGAGFVDNVALPAFFGNSVGSIGSSLYHYTGPDNPINDWLIENDRARYGVYPDLFDADGFNAALLLVEGLKATGGDASADALIPAWEGSSFEGPKGTIEIRAEDHVAIQDMYVFKLLNVDDPDAKFFEYIGTTRPIPPCLLPEELKDRCGALPYGSLSGEMMEEAAPATESTLGTEEDPIIWAVVPSGETERVVTGFEQVAEMIFAETGLVIEPFVATEYAGVIEAMCSDPAGAHMASLATFSYILAADRGCAEAALVSVRFGSAVYNGQIFVRADSGIETLADLAGKTFCRPDPLSTSGWIIPSIELKAAGIDPDTDLAQIVDAGSHDASVAGVYNGDCDAGSSYVDARGTIEEDAPDVMDVLTVISISADIPNDGVQFVTGFNADLQAQVVAALLAIAETEEGVNALGEAYSWGALEAHDDTFYDPFRQVLDAAGVSAGDF